MKITTENINDLNISHSNKSLLKALLIDIEELNNLVDNVNQDYKKLYIDFQDWHNEYSEERTDPCPDYYGCYTLRFEKNPNETCGVEMDIEMLDTVICSLVNYVEFIGDFTLN